MQVLFPELSTHEKSRRFKARSWKIFQPVVYHDVILIVKFSDNLFSDSFLKNQQELKKENCNYFGQLCILCASIVQYLWLKCVSN